MRTLEQAIDGSAIHIRAEGYESLRSLGAEKAQALLYYIYEDCWSQDDQDKYGNGFLGIPKKNKDRIENLLGKECGLIYMVIMNSIIASRKTYHRNNKALRDAYSQSVE